jgi:ADP-L-glycero-D-manno-heptose 6-epimerase
MKILITGHKGFIGQNLTLYLQNEHTLFGYEWQPDNLPEVEGFDWVIHVGAISSTTETDVDKVMLQNYEFSKWLFNQCNSKGVNLQYASSASVYGSGKDFNEESPKSPQSPYAWSKYLFDRWVWNLPQHNIVVQGLRYFNVYGPMEDHKRDQASPITKFTKQAKNDKKIKIFENSNKYLRDFVFVGDVCEVHKQLLENKTPGIYNVGTGVATSFQSVAESVAKKYNASIETIPMPENLKNQYQEYTCADITKLSTVTDIKFATVEEYINGKSN